MHSRECTSHRVAVVFRSNFMIEECTLGAWTSKEKLYIKVHARARAHTHTPHISWRCQFIFVRFESTAGDQTKRHFAQCTACVLKTLFTLEKWKRNETMKMTKKKCERQTDDPTDCCKKNLTRKTRPLSTHCIWSSCLSVSQSGRHQAKERLRFIKYVNKYLSLAPDSIDAHHFFSQTIHQNSTTF